MATIAELMRRPVHVETLAQRSARHGEERERAMFREFLRRYMAEDLSAKKARAKALNDKPLLGREGTFAELGFK